MGNDPLRAGTSFETVVIMQGAPAHPVLKRQNRLGKDPFAGFGTVVKDIKRSGYTKNQPILLGVFEKTRFLCFYIIKSSKKRAKIEPKYP